MEVYREVSVLKDTNPATCEKYQVKLTSVNRKGAFSLGVTVTCIRGRLRVNLEVLIAQMAEHHFT